MGLLCAGRYTLPGEYPIPAKLSQAQLARRAGALVAQVTFWASQPARWILQTVLDHTHSLLSGIVVLALFLRLLFALPTFQADQDRQLGIIRKPVVNFLLALFQLLVMALSIDVVANAVDLVGAETAVDAGNDWADTSSSMWVQGLFVLMLVVYLAPLLKTRSPWRWFALVFIATVLLHASEAVSLGVMAYLICYLAALLVQQWLTIWWFRERSV